MAGKTHLTAKHTPFAYLCTACYTYLRRHHGVGTDIGIVGNLYEVVELYALANIGRTHCRTVYTSVGTNLYIVFDGNYTNLRNLVVTFRTWSESKSVGTDYTTGMKRNVIA